MPKQRSSDTQRSKSRQAVQPPKPKKKGQQSVTEAARAEVPDIEERPLVGAEEKGTQAGEDD